MSNNATAETQEKNQKLGLPDDFPPEILAQILCELPYPDLLTVLRVSKEWKAVGKATLLLGFRCSRKRVMCMLAQEMAPQALIRNSGAKRSGQVVFSSSAEAQTNNLNFQMHPVLPKVAFILGQEVSQACVFGGSHNFETTLASSGTGADLVSIPAVHTFPIQIEEEVEEYLTFQVEVKNSNGVTVLDIFTELAKA
ncbi:hypothetical protein FB451DRAFT_1403204 [Mycena latifolia]|nr:hypothetical protein FB451DRAFT_1403204 [Mycena latifolia]